jgi:hypothetical protein
MTPNAITLLFKEARDAFPPIKGKPTDDNLLSIWEILLPILMEVPYDQLGGVHSLTSLITDNVRYAAEHGGNSFKRPIRLPLYDTSIKDDATTVIRVRAEAAHKARLDNYVSFEVAERGAAKFLRKVVDEVWYNDLKDADTFYTKVTAFEIISFLDANSGGAPRHRHDLPPHQHAPVLRASGWHPPVHHHAGGCAKKGKEGRHAHCQCQTRHDGLGEGPGGPAFSP